MSGWTRENLRHIGMMFRRGTNPAATVYESLGTDLSLAPGPGWLNVGWWKSDGDPVEATDAPRALVERLARHLPKRGTIVDVGNGLGAQDPVIADLTLPELLVAINITEMQLRAGSERLALARARPVCADATRLPVADGVADGVISIEAAFHFPARARFYAEARRVMRPGGVLSVSDVSVERMPRRPVEMLGGFANMRFWGLRRGAAQSMGEMARALQAAGFRDIEIEPCGDRTVDPMVSYCRARLTEGIDGPRAQAWAAAKMLDSWALLRERGVIEYVLIQATAA